MEYAVVEFTTSGEVEIVTRSMLRNFDESANLPCECICDWTTGKKKSKSTSYAVNVVHLGSKLNLMHNHGVRFDKSRFSIGRNY